MTNTVETMRVVLRNHQYHVITNNPKTIALFGTNTIPTPFVYGMPLAEVLEKIKALNPGVKVTIV